MNPVKLKLILFSMLLLAFLSCKSGDDPVVVPDADELSITDLRVSTGLHEADVEFTTNFPTKNMIEFGTAQDALSSTQYDTATFRKSHTVLVDDLMDKTQYYYKISVWTTDSLTDVSDVFTFQTADSSDYPVGPVISNIEIMDLNVTEAEIHWATDQLADSKIIYGVSSESMNDTTADPELTQDHTIFLDGLIQGTTYYFKASSTNNGGLTTISNIATFRTVGTPVDSTITSVRILFVTGSTTAINWVTRSECDSRIVWGTQRDNLSENKSDQVYSMAHTLRLWGLEENTTYYYLVSSEDEYGYIRRSDTLSFSTEAIIKISVPDTTVSLGTDLAYPIIVTDANNLQGLEVIIEYSSAFLRPLYRVEKGPFTLNSDSNELRSEWDDGVHQVTVSVPFHVDFDGNEMLGTEADGSGVVAYVHFEAYFAGEAQMTIVRESFRCYDCYANPIDFLLIDGTVTIE